MKNENTNKKVRTISYVMMITLLGKLMALFRDRMLAQAYGTDLEASAFLAASQLPRVFFDAIFASAVTMSFIPIFSKCMQEGGKKKAFEFSDTFITFVGALMIALTALGMFFSEAIATVLMPKFGAEGIMLTADLLRILFPTMIFTGITFSFIGILQSMERFFVPALTSVVFNAVIIVYFFGPDAQWRIYGLAVVYLIGWVLQAAIQIPSLHKVGYRFRPNFQWNNGYLKQVGILILPVMVSTWVQPLNIMVNIRFASGISDAAVAVINYANGIYTIIVAVFILSIMNVIFPKMSDMVNQGEKEEMEKLTGQTLGISFLLVIPMMVGLMSLGSEVVALLYGGKKFDAISIQATGQALLYFSMGMIGYTLQAVLSRVYFAERNGKVPMIGAIIAIVSNILLCVLLAYPMQINGLALASSISGFLYGVILFLPMLKKGRKVVNGVFFVDILKMGLAAGVMAGVIALIKSRFALNLTGGLVEKIVYLGALVAVGVVVYGIMILLLRVEQMQGVKEFVKKRRNKA